jgi:hypothetical protein
LQPLIHNRLCLLFYAFCLSHVIQAQKDSAFKFRINADAGLIINNSFSNIPKHSEVVDENTVETRAPLDSTKKTRTGFMLGVNFLVFPKESFKGVVGISFARTSAGHHYSFESEGPTNRSGFSKVRTVTSQNIEDVINSLNIQAGIRNRIYDNIFLTSAFVLVSPLKINRTINGKTETFFTSNSGDSSYFVTYNNNEQRKYKRTDQNLCLRFTLEYQFTVGASLARVYLFRNLGLISTLPWWGLGISYTVKH